LRKRIQQLARGKFEYARPLLQFSTDKISIEALEGKDFAGDFVITSGNHIPMRGVIYTSDPRMECLPPQFEGEEVRIRFQYHSAGLVEGDIQKGDFYIICNQGEYNLSFVVSVSRLYADSSAGRIRSLTDFASLAHSSFAEAKQLFLSQHFKNIIKPSDYKALLVYEGLDRGRGSGQKLEEFLIAVQKKKPVKLTLKTTEASFYEIQETKKATIEIQREHWGYLEIEIRSDAPFLVPGKKRLNEDDFMGSVCVFDYYIREEMLHGGKNFGRLTFHTPSGDLTFSVVASKSAAERSEAHKRMQEIKCCRISLTELYVDYRLKKIVTGVWANKTIEQLDHLSALGCGSPLYELMKAQAFLVNRQRQEASWIMEDFKRSWTDKENPIWGYYLYLCTLAEREPSYVNRIAAEIDLLAAKNPDNALLFWIQLFVKEEYYRNNTRRLRAIEHWVGRFDCHSPYLYLEAYYLLWQDPYLLGKLDAFEIEILNWAARQKVLTKDIIGQIIRLVSEKRSFDRFVYRILEACYEVEETDEVLTAVCGYLIRGQCFGMEYHVWYERGIEHELRITSLYEAYLLSLDERKVATVPKMIQMYFQYDSKIDYEKRAVLFVNIIAGKEKQPDVYRKYQRIMEQFAMEQLEEEHINDNLAVIYDEMIQVGILNRELSCKLAHVVFTHKLTCRNHSIAKAIILQKQMQQPQVVTLSGETAYFQVYTEEFCVILEDTCGNQFVDSVAYTVESVMQPERYMDRCLALSPDCLEYALYHFRNITNADDFAAEDQQFFSVILDAPEVSERYKASLIPEVIRFCSKHVLDGTYEAEELEHYLELAERLQLTAGGRRYLIEYLTDAHRYEKAFRMVHNFGYDYLGNAARIALCNYAITECGFEEDDFLLGFVESTFLSGKYSDVMLIYLCKYYSGATKNMGELWQAAGQFQIDTFDLEERIITQMLYTSDYLPGVEQIYESYCAGGGRELVCMAYLSYFAHGFLTKDEVVPEHIFHQIEELYLEEKELNDAGRLALLKYYSAQKTLRNGQQKILDELLEMYVSQNIYFAFYRGFDKKILRKYYLYDKYFVEYHAAPGHRVVINYRLNEDTDYRKEDLVEMYPGIYVREFILFFGEMVQYYLSEEDVDARKVTESNCICNNDVVDEKMQGRYAQLNEMIMQLALENDAQLRKEMLDYYGMHQVTETAFRLL
jgi:hypothetical protein